MSKKRPRRRAGKVLLAIVLVLAAGAGGYTVYLRQNQQEETLSAQNYKEETVRRGSVSSGIQEDGTIEYGTTEQTFTVAEVTTVSASSDTDSSASQDGGSGTAVSSRQSSAQQGGGESQGAAAVENTVSMTGASGMASGSDSSSGNSETGESTSLVVEEVYIAPGSDGRRGRPASEDYRCQHPGIPGTAGSGGSFRRTFGFQGGDQCGDEAGGSRLYLSNVLSGRGNSGGNVSGYDYQPGRSGDRAGRGRSRIQTMRMSWRLWKRGLKLHRIISRPVPLKQNRFTKMP